MLAGLWLWHDALEESHAIAQAIITSSGSLWHAILHRREGDYSNAKYWYERASGQTRRSASGAQARTTARVVYGAEPMP